jgi:hypothetical protein
VRAVAYPEFFFGGGGGCSTSSEDRENRDLGAVAPSSGVTPNFQMGETRILIGFLRCIFHLNPPNHPPWVRQ